MTRAQDWQPIATAPKDGTDIILWLPWVNSARTGRWTMHGRWSADFGHAYTAKLAGEPTHWQPLPPPPSGAAPVEGE